LAANGGYTYTVSNAATQYLGGSDTKVETFTVTSFDGTSRDVSFTIHGTNDAPVLSSSSTSVSLTQGAAPVANLQAGISATDVDGLTTAIRYSLDASETALFSIDAVTGVIGLTTLGAETISGLAGSGVTIPYTLHVTATDAVGGASAQELVAVNVNMAVQAGGTTASLPGSMSDWSIAPSTNNTFVLTNHADPLIQVSLPGTVTSLSFTGGDSVTLANNGSIGTVTYAAGTASSHTITIAPGTSEGTLTVISAAGATVEGAASSTDGVKMNTTVNTEDLNSVFGAVSSDGHITVHTTFGDTVVRDVEFVQFSNATVRIVGAGGYASLSAASAAANSGDVIYVTDSSLASGTAGVINHDNLSIYIASGETADMTLSSSLVQLDGTGANVSVHGTHSFTLTGTSGNDTIHDYTNIASTATNTIRGADGNDNIVAHFNTLGTELIYGEGGNDILIGGNNTTLFGGDGNDTLLAFGGAAALSGGAGDDILLNAYASASSTAKAVVMSGGSGNDTFGLIGTNDASATGSMKTIVADLATGDKIDLAFLEKTTAGTTDSTDQSFASASDLSGGKASMTTAGTTLNLNSFVATSAEVNTGAIDTNSHETGGTMTVSNATLTKTAAAITAGTATTGAIDFNSTFGHLTDTYHTT